MRRTRWTAAAAALAAVLVTGCATTIGGTAEPNPAGLTTASSTPDTSSPESPNPDTSRPEASGTPGPAAPETPTDNSTTAPSTTAPSTTEPTASPTGSSSTTSPTGPSTGSTQAYPTTPLKYNRTPSTQASANLLEGRRIAGSLVVPTLIDPAYTRVAIFSTLPFKGPSAMSQLFVAPVPSVAQRAGMITGFSSARSGAPGALLVAAFEFGTAAQATAAVPALAAASVNKDSDKGRTVVAGYPAAAGQYGSTTEGPYFQSFLPQGRMVLYVYVSGRKQTTAEQATLAARTFKAQSAAFTAFKPTDPNALMQLPVDPEGMLAHTIPNVGQDATVADGYLTAAGQLHYDTDPVATTALFGATGVDAVGGGRATVYRARNAGGAVTVRDNFIASSAKSGALQPYRLTAQAPGAKCLADALNAKYYCVGVRDRYAFELSAQSEADINAVMAAEYQLLDGF